MITIHFFHTGRVCVSPALPFGGNDRNPLKASPLFSRKQDRLWLPVSSYLIEHPRGKVLVDCGWHREMSPNGVYDRKAQIRSLGSLPLYLVNQGVVEQGQTIDQQLQAMGIQPDHLDHVLLTHLDCDHANGVRHVRDAKHIWVSKDELAGSRKKSPRNRLRFQPKWWAGCRLESFDWNDTEGPFGKAFDLFGDGSLKMIAIPGHSQGLCAVKIKNEEGKFVLLVSDGRYAAKSWEEMILPGVCTDKAAQKQSLDWIRTQSMDPACLAVLANHDASVAPHTIRL